jgi:peptidoglycan/LPS O-acetylase OafA/YrhL
MISESMHSKEPAPHSPGIPAKPRQERGIPSLDGVRGLAVLFVIFDHASDEGMRIVPDADFNRVGTYGVYLFFVLSSFLLTYPFLDRNREEIKEPGLWLNYFLRRFLRIVPLYLLALAFFTFTGDLTWSEFRNHVTLREGRWHFWTIPVEFKFYFLLPILALIIIHALRRSWLLSLGLLVGLWICLEWLVFPLEKAWSLDRNIRLERSIETFLLGTAAGVAFWFFRRTPPSPRFRPWSEAIAGACLAGMILRVPAVYEVVAPGEGEIKSFDNDHIFCGVLWSLFLVTMLNGSGWIRRAFEWPPLRYLGLVSYSAYLWHRGVIKLVERSSMPPVAELAVAFLSVVAVASITWFLVERPLSRIRWPSQTPAQRDAVSGTSERSV